MKRIQTNSIISCTQPTTTLFSNFASRTHNPCYSYLFKIEYYIQLTNLEIHKWQLLSRYYWQKLWTEGRNHAIDIFCGQQEWSLYSWQLLDYAYSTTELSTYVIHEENFIHLMNSLLTLPKYLSNNSTYLWMISSVINSLSLFSIAATKYKLAYLKNQSSKAQY